MVRHTKAPSERRPRRDDDEDDGPSHKYLAPPSLESLGLVDPDQPKRRLSGDALPKMKKFRFQLLERWIAANFPPCRVADVGGGKGLLAYLLERSKFESVVIDPEPQELPPRYRDVFTKARVRI